jgi:hypothetical protein
LAHLCKNCVGKIKDVELIKKNYTLLDEESTHLNLNMNFEGWTAEELSSLFDNNFEHLKKLDSTFSEYHQYHYQLKAIRDKEKEIVLGDPP